jgi:small subunit ribosomal protein S8
MTNYPIGDFLIRIKNAVLAGRHEVVATSTKQIMAVAHTLKTEGFLDEVKKEDGQAVVRLSYKKKEPVISNLRLVSRPGLRIYKKAEELAKIKGPSIFIISTSKGIMSSKEALKKRLGGEVIAEVF